MTGHKWKGAENAILFFEQPPISKKKLKVYDSVTTRFCQYKNRNLAKHRIETVEQR